MIIKPMDEHAAELATIDRLLLSEPPLAVGRSLQADRTALLAMLEQKRQVAALLDKRFGDTPDWALIHDLHLEMGEQLVHIDHLLIGRSLQAYILDSKYHHATLRIEPEGKYSFLIGSRAVSISLPIGQLRQQMHFLSEFMGQNGLLPRRLGFTIRPHTQGTVVASFPSDNSLQLAHEKQIRVMTAGEFIQRFSSNNDTRATDKFVRRARQISGSGLYGICAKLSRRHLPHRVDYAARYGLEQGAWCSTPAIGAFRQQGRGESLLPSGSSTPPYGM